MSLQLDYFGQKNNVLQVLSNKTIRRVKKIGAFPIPESEFSQKF